MLNTAAQCKGAFGPLYACFLIGHPATQHSEFGDPDKLDGNGYVVVACVIIN